MRRLCSQCGEDVPPKASCPRCEAPEPRWQPARLSVGDLIARFFMWLAGTVAGLSCLLAVFALFYGWIGPGPGQRVLQVVVAIVVGAVGLPIGLVLIGESAKTLVERVWTHPATDGRSASAITRLGRLVSASGGGRVGAEVLSVTANHLSGAETFAHYGVLRRALPAAYGLANSPPRVDVALLATLLALAGRGRLALRVSRNVSWAHDGQKVTRTDVLEGVELRRLDGVAAPTDADLLESGILAALAPVRARLSPQEGLSPYRVASAVAEPAEEPAWVRLPQVIFAMTRGEVGYRRRLRARLETVTDCAPAQRSAEDVCAELTTTLEAGDRALGAVILGQLEQGFALRAPAASA